MHTFLIGGGRDEAGVPASHRPFAEAVARAGSGAPVVVVVLDEGDDTDVTRWTGALERAGVAGTRPVVVSPARPPSAGDLAGAGGVYVAGGLTPGYRDVLVGGGTAWLGAAREAGVPYAGFSAGAAVAARDALVGGWRAIAGAAEVAVCDEGAGEDLDAVTVAPGLGLVDAVVDVHCAQWGTLTRLVHGLRQRPGAQGFGIDEHTALEVDGDTLRVHGLGAVYRLAPQAAGGGYAVGVLGPGEEAAL